MIKRKSEKGISVIEILIACAVLGIALSAILGLSGFLLSQTSVIKQTALATAFAQETMEIARNFRDNTTWNTNGLGSLAVGSPYYFQKSSSAPFIWQLVQGSENVNGFTRTTVLSSVLRDANSNIVQSGGTADSNTKQVTATVSWSERGKTHQVQLMEYLTNWRQ